MSILAIGSIERYGIGLRFAERQPMARDWRRPNRPRVCESDQRGRTRQGRGGRGPAGASSARAVGNDQFEPEEATWTRPPLMRLVRRDPQARTMTT